MFVLTLSWGQKLISLSLHWCGYLLATWEAAEEILMARSLDLLWGTPSFIPAQWQSKDEGCCPFSPGPDWTHVSFHREHPPQPCALLSLPPGCLRNRCGRGITRFSHWMLLVLPKSTLGHVTIVVLSWMWPLQRLWMLCSAAEVKFPHPLLLNINCFLSKHRLKLSFHCDPAVENHVQLRVNWEEDPASFLWLWLSPTLGIAGEQKPSWWQSL